MLEWLNKPAKIVICIDGVNLYYTAKLITEISGSHISFIDKFDKHYTYSLKHLVSINESDK